MKLLHSIHFENFQENLRRVVRRSFRQGKFSLKSEADFLNRLSLYLSAQLSLSESLKLLEVQTEKKRMQETFSAWRELIESGKSLAQTFEIAEGLAVSETTKQAAHLGEKSGSLSVALRAASLQIKRGLDIKKKVAGAIAYPIAIIACTSVLVLGLMVFVFPKIIPLFTTLKVSLPLSTRILIGISTGLTKNWLQLFCGLSICIVAFIAALKKSKIFRTLLQKITLRIPLIGAIIRIKITSSTFDTLYSLLVGGEQLSDALLHVSNMLKRAEYQHAYWLAGDEVVHGRSLADFFRRNTNLFPAYVFGIISVGERTGKMADTIKDVSDIAKEELDDKLKIMTSSLEPVLMVSMSLIIGFIALSIILPIYGITSHFQNV